MTKSKIEHFKSWFLYLLCKDITNPEFFFFHVNIGFICAGLLHSLRVVIYKSMNGIHNFACWKGLLVQGFVFINTFSSSSDPRIRAVWTWWFCIKMASPGCSGIKRSWLIARCPSMLGWTHTVSSWGVLKMSWTTRQLHYSRSGV